MRVKERRLGFPLWNLDKLWAMDGHLGYCLSGCFGSQDVFGKTLTSLRGFGQVRIGTSGDSNFIFAWSSSI